MMATWTQLLIRRPNMRQQAILLDLKILEAVGDETTRCICHRFRQGVWLRWSALPKPQLKSHRLKIVEVEVCKMTTTEM